MEHASSRGATPARSTQITRSQTRAQRAPQAPQGRTPQRGRRRAQAPARAKKRYVASLDGFRALAVLSVIVYHMRFTWGQGGLLGVTMFFVLSGYLITSLLLAEYDETGTISLKGFWLRRVRRIIPAVVFAVIGTALLCTIFNHALLTRMRPDVVPSLLFYNNWWQIFNGASYFDNIGNSPLQHFWSLSIEEQFYVVWPIVLLLCMKFGVPRSTMQKGIVVLIVASALAMALLYNPNADPSRVYFGTDTRAFSLLIGALLAFVWPYQQLDENSGRGMAPQGRLILNVVGIAAIVGLLAMVGLTNGFSAFNYRGGIVLCSLLAAVAIAVLVHPASLVSRFFSLAPLVWIGKVSYSMYLWHWPIILLMTSSNQVGEVPVLLRVVQLVVIFIVSSFSYYIVENPIRHGAIGNFVRGLRAGEFTVAEWLSDHRVPAIVAMAVVLVAVLGLLLVPRTSFLGDEAAVMGQGQGEGEGDDAASAQEDVQPYDILLIGDSVSVRAIPYFEETFPFGHIDSMQNRQLYEAPDIYKWYRDQGLVGDVVVFALGTNGYVVDEQTDALMAEVGSDKHVWFINTRSTTDFMYDSNEALARAVAKYDNAELIDWFGLSDGHSEYFDGDGTHLTDEAAQLYTRIIYDVVASYLPEHTEAEWAAVRGEAQEEPEDPLETAVNTALADSRHAADAVADFYKSLTQSEEDTSAAAAEDVAAAA